MKTIAAALVCAAGIHAAEISADSARGERLFETLSCVQCHSVNGQGGKVGPDLGRRLDRGMTPSTLAATMWNHAPAMWAAMRAKGIRAGDLNERAANDLFAYFYSAHFFDKPGDAGRGKQAFAAKHCDTCHGLATPKHEQAKPASQWTAVGNPMEMVNAMWNHGANMRDEFSKRKLKWPDLQGQDLTDMLVYLRNLPAAKNGTFRVEIVSSDVGRLIFESKGCSTCHRGDLGLGSGLRGKTLVDIAVAMWNHEPRMPTAPAALTLDEMRDLTGYLWAEQFFSDASSAAAGEKVFTRKQCALCHNDPYSGAPKLAGKTFTGAVMVSALWRHGPSMFDAMETKRIPWPRFEGQDMANLIAFLTKGAPAQVAVGH